MRLNAIIRHLEQTEPGAIAKSRPELNDKEREYAERIFFEKDAAGNQLGHEGYKNQRPHPIGDIVSQNTLPRNPRCMKVIVNWRYWAMTALTTVGALLIFAAFGDFTATVGIASEMFCRIFLFAAGVVVLYVMHRFTRRWERGGKIPEFTNQNK